MKLLSLLFLYSIALASTVSAFAPPSIRTKVPLKASTRQSLWAHINQQSIKQPNQMSNAKQHSYMPDGLLPPERNRKANSTHRLSRIELQQAMTAVKRFMESRLERDLKLVKVSYLKGI